MSDYCDAETHHKAYAAARRLPDDAHLAQIIEAVLDVASPLIAAKALRDLADAADNRRLPVLDGGSSYIDIYRRADEISVMPADVALARTNYNHSTRRAMLGREWDELTPEEQSGWLSRARERMARPESIR